jgi:Flp pilus assembly protein TadG
MISRASAMGDERGAVAAELAVVIPALILMLGMIIAGGRIWFARTTVVEAAQTAARAASLERSAGHAASAGRDAGARSMSTAGLNCASSSISVDTGAFGVPVGVPATISATVRCTVRLGDLGLPPLPGSTDLTARASTALDTYRGR